MIRISTTPILKTSNTKNWVKKNGGDVEIRTLDTRLTYTRFPIVLLKPARTHLRPYVAIFENSLIL